MTSAPAVPKPRTAKQVVTPKARLNYAHLFEPAPRMRKAVAGSRNAELVFQCCLVFEAGTDIQGMRNAAAAACKEKWGDQWQKISAAPTFKRPFKSSADRADQEGFPPGSVFITVWSKNKPGIVDQVKRPILDPNQLYSGCYVKADLNAYAYEQEGGRGVAFGLNNIQKIADGERLDGRRDPQAVFDVVEGFDAAADNPLDDDIPF
jgi:hypothetical protein